MEISPRLIAESSPQTHSFFTPIRLSPLEQHILTSEHEFISIYSAHSLSLLTTLSCNKIYSYYWHPKSTAYLLLLKGYPMFLYSLTSDKLQTFPVYNHLQELRTPMAAYVSDCYITTVLGNSLKYYDIETGTLCLETALRSDTRSIRPRGIMSALTETHAICVIGSYSGDVFLYDLNSSNSISTIKVPSGVIQIEVSDQTLLISTRANNYIYCYDIRHLSSPVLKIYCYRTHRTQQRILFDYTENLLITGNHDGSVYSYNLLGNSLEWCFMGHFDAVNSVQLGKNCLYTSSGQRQRTFSDKSLSLIRSWDLSSS